MRGTVLKAAKVVAEEARVEARDACHENPRNRKMNPVIFALNF